MALSDFQSARTGKREMAQPGAVSDDNIVRSYIGLEYSSITVSPRPLIGTHVKRHGESFDTISE